MNLTLSFFEGIRGTRKDCWNQCHQHHEQAKVSPDKEAPMHCSESRQIWRLPSTPWCFFMPSAPWTLSPLLAVSVDGDGESRATARLTCFPAYCRGRCGPRNGSSCPTSSGWWISQSRE